MKVKRLRAGEWEEPVMQGYKFECCECHLVHRMDFRIHKGQIQFRVFNDRRATSAARRVRGSWALEP